MKKIIIPFVICLVVLLSAIGILQWRSQNADDRMIAAIEQETGEEITLATSETETVDVIAVQSNVAYNPRVENGSFVIGVENAPVTIMEFSSLSCPHCASFHSGALPDVKKDYVNTGKVKFVFNDFPLNQPAIAGSLLLKCVAPEKRYDFMEMLFEQQPNWAFDSNYQTKLKQYAALLGVSNEKAEECMNDSAAEAKMFEKMQSDNARYNITSTPSFVFMPSNEVVTGAQPYGAFSTRIEKLLEEK